MKHKILIILVSIIILSLIFYNLYKKNNVENFVSSLTKMKSKKNMNSNKNKTNNNNNNNNNNADADADASADADADDDDNTTKKLKQNLKKSLNSLKSKKTGTTFEDLLNATEKMDPDKYSLANMQKSLSDYSKSFKKEKFNNNSKNTAESFEKFAFYKEKFFEIFS